MGSLLYRNMKIQHGFLQDMVWLVVIAMKKIS